jgi:hypothetical protein
MSVEEDLARDLLDRAAATGPPPPAWIPDLGRRASRRRNRLRALTAATSVVVLAIVGVVVVSADQGRSNGTQRLAGQPGANGRLAAANCVGPSIQLGPPSVGGGLGTLYQIVPVRNIWSRPCDIAVSRAWYTGTNGRQIGNLVAGEAGLDGSATIDPTGDGRLIVGVANPDNFAGNGAGKTCRAVEARTLHVAFAGIGELTAPANYQMCSVHNQPYLRLYGTHGTGNHQN